MDKQGSVTGVEGRTLSVATVVLLHGIWMPGAEMLLFRKWLEEDGEFKCRIYSYPSVRASLQQNADRLAGFVRDLDVPEVHLVGHSLGGIIALRMLAGHDDIPPGRVVCLGSPLCGSHAAAVLLSKRWGRVVIGKTLSEGVVREPASVWAEGVISKREVGVIAGTVSVGMGRIIARFDGDNDGTVAVEETRLPGVRDHLCMRVNHTGLVTSADVVRRTLFFLRHGRFGTTIP